MGLHLLVHAHAGVRHGEAHIGARARPGNRSPAWLPSSDVVGGLDGEPPAPRHGVPGVQGQVEDHLLHLARDRRSTWCRSGIAGGGQLDVLADEPAQHLAHVGHRLVEVQDLRDTATCLRLKVSSWRVRAAARSPALRISYTFSRCRIVALHGMQQELAVAGDGREQVVEVVGHAAGQPAHRLHLLGLPQLLLAAAQGVLHRPLLR